MTMRNRLPALALIAAVGTVCPAVGTAAGEVVFVTGHATLVDQEGKAARVQKGQPVRPGDLVRTSRGQLQLQFPDGTYVSLAPNTDLRLDTYRYAAQSGGPGSASFTLYRGRARCLTGAIARSQGGRFRLNTPYATLRAGAAEFSALVGDGLQISLGRGSAEVRNGAGVLRLAAGQRGFVYDRAAPPLLVGTIVPAPVTPH
jgi:hypothetical protein